MKSRIKSPDLVEIYKEYLEQKKYIVLLDSALSWQKYSTGRERNLRFHMKY